MSGDDVVGVVVAICFGTQIIWMFAVWIRATSSIGLFEDALRKHRPDVWQSTFGNSTWRTFKAGDGKILTKLFDEMASEKEPLSTLAKRCQGNFADYRRLGWMMFLGFIGIFVLVVLLSFLLPR